MFQHRRTKVINSVIGCALIFSMMVSPLAPRGHIVFAALEPIQTRQAALELAPTDFTFTNTATVVGGKPRAEAGDTLRYNLTLTNNGADAQDVVIQDLLGPNLSLVPGSVEVTPLAYNQSLITSEDTPLSLTLTGSDGDGDALLFSVTANPLHGDLSGTAPDLTYTPDVDYVGSDSFTFVVNDGNVDSQSATISIQMSAINDAPICSAVSITTVEDTPASGGPACSDAELDPLTVEIDSQPANGSASIVGGELNYAPAPNFFGVDSFTYKASDALNTSNIALVNVTITSVNDAPSADPQTLTTNEDTALTVTLTGLDVESDPLTFTVTGQPQHGSLSGSVPALVYTPNADYNGSDSLSFMVCDDAATPLCDSADISLTVTAINDAPSFSVGPDQTVLEDSGANVVNPWATNLSAGPADEAGQTLTFEVVGNTNPGYFSAGPTISATGGLAFTSVANANGSASITIRLKDNGGTSGGGIDFSSSQTFNIHFTEVNDAPVVQTAIFSLDEASANGTAAGTVTYNDPDASQTHTFAITAGNTGSAFTINSSTGTITVVNTTSLDFEITPTFSLTVQVTDDGAPVQSGSNTITIDLNDLEETPSVDTAAFDLDENSANGTVVGAVTFGNKDVGQNHTYSITSGNTGGAFAIDPVDGEISVANTAALDFETHPVFTLTVKVSDDRVPANNGSNTVTVSLKNVNEAPLVDTAGFTLDENSADGTSLGSVTFVDPDASQTHTFAITAGNTATAFAIDPATGSLTIANRTALDYETHSSFTLTVQVTDNDSLTGNATITVNLNDVNEAPVVNATSFSIAENSANGVTIGTATFSDQDTGQTHTFAITGGNTGGTFAIHPTSGVISVASNALLNYETNLSFTLTVQVTDNGGLADTASIAINLIDVNETPIVNAATLNIDENSVNGSMLQPGPVTYTDPDSGQTHVFSITAGNSLGAFAINAATGAISVADGTLLDYETLTSYTLTVKVTDNGSPVLFGAATITILVNNVEEAPVVIGENHKTIGNTLLEVSDGLAGPAPRIFISGNILSNDIDPDYAGALTAGPATTTSANGGTVNIGADGSFTYLPPAGSTAADSFTYSVTDVARSTTTGTVNIAILSMVWYVNNTAPAGGSGRSTSPFNTLAAAESASGVNSTIYVFSGDSTTNGQNSGITLKNGQRLIGAGVALDVPVEIVSGEPTTNLLPAGTQPLVDNTNVGGNGVTAANVSGIEIRGLNLAGAANAINISTIGAYFGSAIIQNNTIRAAGAEGINVQSKGGPLSVDARNNSITATGHGFNAQKTSSGALTILFSENAVKSGATAVVINNSAADNLTITGFKNNSVDKATAASGIVITSAIFDSIPGGAFQTVDGGNTSIGVSSDAVGSSGMVLTSVKGDINFTDLDIFANAGAGLQITSSNPFNAATPAGFRLTVTSGAGTLAAVGGPALDVNTATLDLQLASLSTANSPTTGVSLVNVPGTVSAAAGSINNATGTDFNVNGGNANITYNGTIANNAGKSVSVVSHSGGIVAFNGSISDSGAGVFLNSNTGATIAFSGGLSLSTGSSPAFTATAGGRVTVTGANNTLTTTTGVALNVANTTIGDSGLTFRSISANGASNGIVLNATGASGGLKVTGTGPSASGGTLQNLTSDCVSLTSTTNVEFNDVNIQDCGGMGINATSVNGFIFRDGQVLRAGNANSEHGMRFDQLTGTALIQNTTITNAYEDGILLTNTSGVLEMTVRSTTISQNNITYGEDGLQFRLSSTATAKMLVDASTFTNLQRDGIDGAVQDSAVLDLTINNSNHFTNNNGNGGINLSSNGAAALRLDLTGNTFENTVDTPVNLVSMGASTFDGRVSTNTISNPNTLPLDGFGVRLAQEDNSLMTVEVNSNTIQNTYLSGFEAVARLATSTGTLNLTMRNNTVNAPISSDYGAFLKSGNSADSTNNKNVICLDMGYNGVNGGNKIYGSTGYAGVALVQNTGSTFNVESWNTTLHPTITGHIQAYNSPTTAEYSGTFISTAVSCPMPTLPGLPAAVASLTEQSSIMAFPSSPSTSGFSLVRLSSSNTMHSVASASADAVNINLDTLPAGKSVTVTFDVKLAASLPESMLKVSNQAAATSSSFIGVVLSDDPITPAQPDATESLLYRAPMVHDDAYSTPEDTPLTVTPAGVLSNDTTAIGYEGLLSAVKDSDPTSGGLTFAPDGSFVFTPSKDFDGSASFTYHANDTQSGSNTALVSITVTPVNDAPVLDNTGSFSLLPISQHDVDNSGTLVSVIIASAGGDPIQDVDSDALEGIAVTSVDNTYGKWQYSLDSGGTWQDFGAPTGSAARLLAADANTRVRLVPDQSWNGVIDPGIGFHAWDGTSGTNGGTLDIADAATQTAFSTAAATASIAINAGIDLSLTMTALASPVIAGSRLDYTLTVANAGPADATSVVVTDTLPAGATFVSASPQCSAVSSIVTCAIDYLAAGGSLNLTITAATDTAARGRLTNAAAVTAAESDENPDNNIAETDVEVVADLQAYSLGDKPGDEWNRPVSTVSPNGTQLMGEFGNETITLTLNDLPPHTQAIVTFDLHIIRTWDGNQVNWPGNIDGFPTMSINSVVGPDRWRLDADGANLLDTTFANWSALGFNQAYPENYPAGSYPAQTGAAQVNALDYVSIGYGPQDSTYHMRYPIEHQDASLVLEFTASGLQELADESWGLSNVQVVLTAGADPYPHKLYFPIVFR